MYDNDELGYNIFYLAITGAVLCDVCFFISWWKFKKESNPEENDDNDEEAKTNKLYSGAVEEEEMKELKTSDEN